MATVLEVTTGSDVAPGSVRSRISWGAILAGVAVAVAIYSLLSMLGIAVGFTVSDEVDRSTLGTGAGVWAFIALLIALFVGGWVTTQCTSGETRTEAVLYGVVLWATTSVVLLWLTTMGLRTGLDAVRTARSAASVSADRSTETFAGASEREQRQAMERLRDQGRESSWWAFAGTLASMLAAIGGALVGPYEFTIRREYRGLRENRTAPL